MKMQEMGGVLYKLLPRSHRKRKRKATQRKEVISNKQSIHSRDEIVEEHSRIGDIEIDSVVGSVQSGWYNNWS